MNSQNIKQHSLPCDSETSVDYYVTTVNNCSSQNDDFNAENQAPSKTITLVVSIDQAGTIKLRKRKKSKRRKKKSRSVIQESELHASDDGILYRSSSSDSSDKKVPRRSVSLCDRYVKKNSTSESFNKILSDYKRGDTGSKRHSSKVPERGAGNHVEEEVPVDHQNDSKPLTTISGDNGINCDSPPRLSQNDSSLSLDQEQLRVTEEPNETNINSDSNQGTVVKKLDRNDVIATLNAFMLEVQHATSVAKQQEDVKRKDPTPLESPPSIEVNPGVGPENKHVPIPVPDPASQLMETPPATESRSVEQESVTSSVFLSDTDQSGKGEPPISEPVDSVKSFSDEKEKMLEIMLMEKVGNTEVNGLSNHVPSQCEVAKEKNFDYGLAHLEQVCKLMEQIGDLRKRNHSLVKQVHLLESEVKSLKRDKGFINTGYPDTYQTLNLPKRTRPVGRLKDVFVKSSRKISYEKQNTKRSSQFLTYSNDASDRISLSSSTPASGFMPLSNKKVMSRSHVDLNFMNRRRRYSHDDIEVDVKSGKWRFWKTPTRSVDRNPSRKHPLPNNSDSADKSSEVIQRAYLTVDSLLATDDKMTSHDRSRMKPLRTSSRASDMSGDTFGHSMYLRPADKPPVYDENVKYRSQRLSVETPTHKESFREKISKWEKSAARRLFLDKRSNSVDRMRANENGTDFSPQKENLSSNDIYKSMPCVLIGPDGNRFDKKHSIQSVSSNEWNSLQETFPTKHRSEKPGNGIRNAIRTHLPSPLRRKSTSKRKTWSFAKRKSGYYLPTTDFSFASSSYDLTESIGEQLTLELDQDAVKGAEKSEIVDDDGLIMKKTPYRAKLNDIDGSGSDSSLKTRDPLPSGPPSLVHSRRDTDSSTDDEPARSRCPFFPTINSKKRTTPVFL